MTATSFFINHCKSQKTTKTQKPQRETETSISLRVIVNFVFSAIALTEDSLIKSLGGITFLLDFTTF